jgi:hypothetical protein
MKTNLHPSWVNAVGAPISDLSQPTEDSSTHYISIFNSIAHGNVSEGKALVAAIYAYAEAAQDPLNLPVVLDRIEALESCLEEALQELKGIAHGGKANSSAILGFINRIPKRLEG